MIRKTTFTLKGKTRERILNFLILEEGATAVEYAIMAALITGVIALSVAGIGSTLDAFFRNFNDLYPK